jgi:hypothetical protein
MKKCATMWVTLMAGVLIPWGNVYAQTSGLKLTNKTGYAMLEIQMSPSNKKTWSHDVLGVKELQDNESIRGSLPAKIDCIQDVRVFFKEDGDEMFGVIWPKINFCSGSELSLLYNKSTGKSGLMKE